MARCCRTGNAAAQLPAAALACAASAAEAFDPMLITGLATTLGCAAARSCAGLLHAAPPHSIRL